MTDIWMETPDERDRGRERFDADLPYLCPDCDRPQPDDCVCWMYDDVTPEVTDAEKDEDTLDAFERIAAARHNAKRAKTRNNQKGEAA